MVVKDGTDLLLALGIRPLGTLPCDGHPALPCYGFGSHAEAHVLGSVDEFENGGWCLVFLG